MALDVAVYKDIIGETHQMALAVPRIVGETEAHHFRGDEESITSSGERQEVLKIG